MVLIRHIKAASLTKPMAPLGPPHSQNAGSPPLVFLCPGSLVVFCNSVLVQYRDILVQHASSVIKKVSGQSLHRG